MFFAKYRISYKFLYCTPDPTCSDTLISEHQYQLEEKLGLPSFMAKTHYHH
jgi:hypothetical protein